MRVAAWLQPPRQLMATFLAVALVSTGALAWLTYELLAQDRAAEQQRRRERLEQTADSSASDMARRLAAFERHLDDSGPAGSLPAGAILVSWHADDLTVSPGGGLLYRPTAPAASLADEVLAEAERAELAAGDLTTAIRLYTTIATTASNRTLQATAWSRVARIHRKLDARRDAVAAYDRVETFGPALIDGIPAALVARAGRASVFERENNTSSLREEAGRLSAELQAGSLPVTHAQYAYYSAEAARWLGRTPPDDADGIARADAVNWLWARRSDLRPRDRRLQVFPTGSALLVWTITPGGASGSALVAGPQVFRSLAMAAIPPRTEWAMTDPEGRLVAGTTPPSRGAASRASAATDLPWTLHVFEASAGTAPAEPPRRTLLLFVIASVAMLVATGWYFIWRGVSREVRLARLQSDFVAAVSHEFRSPLTSLRYIGDLLVEDRFSSEEHKKRSYGILVNETDRLGRLVEGVLDFARFEAGTAALRLAPMSIADTVRTVVADFRNRPGGGGRTIALAAALPEAIVNADRDALARAIWNLLDNAEKYSPPESTIWVEVKVAPESSVVVSIRDEGIGIPRNEQRAVFDRFVRGREATARRIQGTGIGLALVREIMRAHAGSVTVESTPGAGSTFTLNLRQATDAAPPPRDHGQLATVPGNREPL